jgi:predicted dehydrogenase
MEAFMYRFHPQIAQAIQLVRDGRIGDLRFIQAEFSFNLPFTPAHRIYDARDYGGGTLDAGGYPLSIARLFAGVASGKPFSEPVSLRASATLHDVGVDNLALAILRFPNDVLAEISTGINVEHGQVTRLYGTKGSLIIQYAVVRWWRTRRRM